MENKSFKWWTPLLLLISLHAFGQEFGGNPPSLEWRQLNTDTARVIFPAGLEQQAREVSGIIHRLAAIEGKRTGYHLKKIPIVLQNQTTFSNGYVSLGPYRSEFFMTPRQNSFELGSLPWHKSLALHEYRHAQQYANFRKGLSKLFYFVFGQEGQALANNLAVPNWFFEGDAVYQETHYSAQGRGRLPYFYNGYKSLWAAGKDYSWMKLRNGSYRDYVPDHYQLGYLLVDYGYHKFGTDAWHRITADAASFKSLFYPFQRSFRKNTGQPFRSFVAEAMNYFSKADSGNIKNDVPSQFARSGTHFAADEQYPQWADSNHLLYLKASYSKIPAFYMRNILTGKEKKISTRSLSSDSYFSSNGRLIVYAAYRPDARWGWKNYEELAVVDIQTGKERKVTRNTKYQSPDISPDGTKIVAVHADPAAKYALHIVNVSNGDVIAKVPNTHHYVYTYPKFYNDDTIVSAVRNEAGEMALGKFSIATGRATWLTRFCNHVIAFPQVHRDTVFFSMAEGGSDRLFAASGGRLMRFHPAIKNHYTGNYQLTGKDGKYAWTSFTAAGFHLFQAGGSFEEMDPKNLLPEDPFPAIHESPGINLVADSISSSAKTEKYKADYRLLNFHSWRPYFSDPEYTYSVISENILNTLRSEVYFTYNRNEKFKETGASFSYGAWYPVINGGASFTFDRSFTDSAKTTKWNEFNARVGASLPLTFVHKTFTQSVTMAATLNTQQVYYKGASKALYDNKQFYFGDYTFSFTNQKARARQQVFPKIAQTFFLRYRRIVNKYDAHQLLASAGVYLPGFFPNNSIILQGSYQHRDTLQQYNFTNAFPFSRGYPDINFPRMWKLGGDYHFPLAYPEWGFANIVYLSRLRADLFYDYSRVRSLRTGSQFGFSAVGAELHFDTRWWNQQPVSFGIRYSRLLDAGTLGISPNRWELILPVNLLAR